MSKAVMLSIRPKWVEKIANGEKTIEVRKTRPKLKTPFKCYIYCTAERAGYDALWLMCLDALGYSAKDIEVITPEQYEAEFGGDEDG